MEELNRQNEIEDDGSLACLHLTADDDGYFHCPETTQSRLVNTTFWVVDYIDNVPTKWTKERGDAGKMVVKIKPERDAPESEARKFFTGSREIQTILRKVKEMGKLPRRVTLRGGGNRYYLE